MSRLLLPIAALLGLLVLWPVAPAYAHAELQQAEPAAGASVPAPPQALRLRFSEPLDHSATRVEVYDEQGNRVDRGTPTFGPPNDRVVTVDLADLPEGVYTVRWWSLSQADGHRWQGSYRFGVGRTPPATDGATAALPSPAEVAVQWAGLLAASLVLGLLVFRAWAVESALATADPGSTTPADAPGHRANGGAGEASASVPSGASAGGPNRAMANVTAGDAGDPAASGAEGRSADAPAGIAVGVPAGVAFAALAPRAMHRLGRALTAALIFLAVASIGEIAAELGLFSISTPEGAGGASAFAGLGKVGALALLRLTLAPMIAYLAAPSGSAGMAAAFAALLVLTRGQSSHAAANGFGAVLVDTAHQLAAGAWIGGIAAFALVIPVLTREQPAAARIVARRFSRLALASAAVALVTGVASGWLIGLDPSYLLASRYGQSLVVKLVLVAGLFGAGFLVWRWRRTEATPRARPGAALLAELGLGVGVLLAAGALAVLPPPAETSTLPLELVQPVPTDGHLRMHLTLDRAGPGEVRATVQVTDETGRPQGLGLVHLTASEIAPLTASLDAPPAPVETFAEEQGDGRNVATFSPFARPGWWRVDVTGTVHLKGTMMTTFDVLVPDPNRAGLDPPSPDPAAEALFEASLDRLERLTAVRQRDVLADGTGGLVQSTAEYVAPDRYRLVTAEGDESIAIGAAQAFRRGDEEWRTLRRSAPFHYPAYHDNYAGATAQRLGYETALDGASVRVLSFYVPRDRAWYCWWVGRDDGLLRREAMVAPSHYMTTRYDDFDRPASIALP
ncbi:MAG: copper resistance protein CopC [Chloroflexi bacterium]|nr:copper resistance protein CopC [Chloroflexota bacterium]